MANVVKTQSVSAPVSNEFRPKDTRAARQQPLKACRERPEEPRSSTALQVVLIVSYVAVNWVRGWLKKRKEAKAAAAAAKAEE
jgi:hypothetical protein